MDISSIAVSLVLLFSGHKPGSFSQGSDPAALLIPGHNAVVFLTSQAPPAERKLDTYLEAISKPLDARIRGALMQIDEAPRRLLALKYYLKRQGDLRRDWTWTPAQFMRYKRSLGYLHALSEVEKVKAAFAELNPGYELNVHTEVRTLTDQLELWNQTPSVIASGQGVFAACMKAIADTAYADNPDKFDITRFLHFLGACKTPAIPTVAVPGFSQHGQLRAFDFVIWQGDKITAGTDADAIVGQWDRAGWTAKLKEAVTQASTHFSGPLAAPREPWHYTYTP